MPKSAHVLHKLKSLSTISTEATYKINRNPRNLERLTIGYKPSGYHLEKPGRSFWHKFDLISIFILCQFLNIFPNFRLELNATGRYINANVIHYQAGSVLQASTSEWAIKKQLFKTNDTCAYINLARVILSFI